MKYVVKIDFFEVEIEILSWECLFLDNTELKLCPFCGEEIKKDAIKCRYCRSFLNEENMAIAEKIRKELFGQAAKVNQEEQNTKDLIGNEKCILENDKLIQKQYPVEVKMELSSEKDNAHYTDQDIPWNGGSYYGQLKHGKPHGKGVLYLPDGHKYEGEWIDGKKHGSGILIYPSGAKYVGTWADDNLSGKGKMIYLKEDDAFPADKKNKAIYSERDSESPKNDISEESEAIPRVEKYANLVADKIGYHNLPKLPKINKVQDIISYVINLGNTSIRIRAFYGAFAALASGIIITWFLTTILLYLATSNLDPIATSIIKRIGGNPFFNYTVFHGVPFYANVTISAFGFEESTGVSARYGSFILLIIPFIFIFTASIYNVKLLKPLATKERLNLSVQQGVIYGIFTTFMAILFGSLISFSGSYEGAALHINDGFYFFRTLFITTIWGILFSFIGIFYSESKFNYTKIINYLKYQYKHGLLAALKVIKIIIVITIIITPVIIIWFMSDENTAGLLLSNNSADWLILPLLFIMLIPMVILLIQGAPFEVTTMFDKMYLSLWRGYGLQSFDIFDHLDPQSSGPSFEIIWQWYFLILIFIPILLGFIGGYTIQKNMLIKSKPWESAFYFCIFYTIFAFVLTLGSQVSMITEHGQFVQMFMDSGGQQPYNDIVFGSSMPKVLLSVFLFSFIPGVIGAYYHNFSHREGSTSLYDNTDLANKTNSNLQEEIAEDFIEVTNKEYSKKMKEVKEHKLNSCLKCGFALKLGAMYCTNCGEVASEKELDSERENQSPTRPICSSCSGFLKEGAKFCTHCGQPQG